MTRSNLLIFDFDGTIADTFENLVRISNLLSEEFRFKKIMPNDIDCLKSKDASELIAYLNIPLLKIPMIVARAKQELHKEISVVRPIQGLKDALSALKSLGHSMNILSSNSAKNVSCFLKGHQLNFFETIRTTPKIWSKHWALKALMDESCRSASQVIYIGDETRDIVAARKAGIRCAAVTWGYNSRIALDAHKPDFMFHHPKELLYLSYGE